MECGGETLDLMQPVDGPTDFPSMAPESFGLCDGSNQLWRIGPDTNIMVVLKDYHGKLFNGPNDIWIAHGGGIYFTDPFYKRPYWKRGPKEMDECVYYLSADHKRVNRVINDLKQPNGIIGTPDGKMLYVADIRRRKNLSLPVAR